LALKQDIEMQFGNTPIPKWKETKPPKYLHTSFLYSWTIFVWVGKQKYFLHYIHFTDNGTWHHFPFYSVNMKLWIHSASLLHFNFKHLCTRDSSGWHTVTFWE